MAAHRLLLFIAILLAAAPLSAKFLGGWIGRWGSATWGPIITQSSIAMPIVGLSSVLLRDRLVCSSRFPINSILTDLRPNLSPIYSRLLFLRRSCSLAFKCLNPYGRVSFHLGVSSPLAISYVYLWCRSISLAYFAVLVPFSLRVGRTIVGLHSPSDWRNAPRSIKIHSDHSDHNIHTCIHLHIVQSKFTMLLACTSSNLFFHLLSSQQRISINPTRTSSRIQRLSIPEITKCDCQSTRSNRLDHWNDHCR
jgi:hypothetical protein